MVTISQRWSEPSVGIGDGLIRANPSGQHDLYHALDTTTTLEQLQGLKVPELASLRNAAYGPVEVVAEPGTYQTGCNGTVVSKLPPAPEPSVQQVQAVPRSMLVSAPDSDMVRQGKLMRERRQLIDWGENLYQQVDRLEQDKGDLERRYMESQSDLEQTRRRCAELERLLHEGAGAPTVGENSDLRKQLAAYAVEIDVLREEKAGLERTISDAQQSLQRLGLERDGYLQQVNDIASSHTSLQQKLEKLDSDRANEVKLKAAAEGRLNDTKKELTTAHESLQHEQEQHKRRLDALRQAEQQLRLKDEQYGELLDVVQPLTDNLKVLQDNYVRQTREYEQFIENVRRKQFEGDQTLQEVLHQVSADDTSAYQMGMEMDRLRQEHSQQLVDADSYRRMQSESSVSLEQQLQASRLELGQAQQHLAQSAANEQQYAAQVAAQQAEIQHLKDHIARRRPPGPGPPWARRALEHNIAREMKLASTGTDLFKVHDGSGQKKEARFVVISDGEMLMKWSKTPGRLSSSCTNLDLYSVIRLDYGSMSRPAILHDEQPWLCFSLYSTKRSYDFICPNEAVTRAYVLTLSRLCNWASGAVQTRSRFEYLKGWCKIEESCYKKKTSLSAALIRAAGITSRRTRQSGLALPGEREQPPGGASQQPPTPQSAYGAPTASAAGYQPPVAPAYPAAVTPASAPGYQPPAAPTYPAAVAPAPAPGYPPLVAPAYPAAVAPAPAPGVVYQPTPPPPYSQPAAGGNPYAPPAGAPQYAAPQYPTGYPAPAGVS
mmetsp:Transcript_48463/g.113424  ORF Transcript_48463/g.113424 Transcript_48463/m.113424 type:complete len:774 (-) Transcript_48463:129-2450(-)